jgi:hypothetical protein
MENSTPAPTFKMGDLVKRKTGSWHGVIVGEYSTDRTLEGYNVMSMLEKGAVHVEPVGMLVPWDGTLPDHILALVAASPYLRR